MRKAPMNEFPVEEFQSRIHALTEKMRAAGLDAVMLSNKENTRYFCGLQSIIWSSKVSTPGILLVNADGEMALIGSASAVETARHTSVVDDAWVLCYDRNQLPGVPSTYPDAIADAFRRLGVTGGKVGTELGDSCYLHMQYHWYLELCELLPGIQFQDASQIIFSLRSVKSEAEIRLLTDLCGLNEAALDAAAARVVPGQTTEQGFFRLYAEEAFRRHCENVPEFSIRSTAQRMPLEHCPPSGQTIQEAAHGALFLSGGLFSHGYQSYTERAMVVDSLTERQKSLFQCALETARFACEQIRPGADTAAVRKAITAYASGLREGAAYLSADHLGGGLGLDPLEPPYFSSASAPAVLHSGMVLCISPRFGTPELGYFPCALTLAVTEDGCRLLSSLQEDVFLLGK